MNGCVYCGATPAPEVQGIRACHAHDDLPEIEQARNWLERRACLQFDGHTQYWNNQDAHAAKVLVRGADRRLRETAA